MKNIDNGEDILKEIRTGENIFLTGSAGSGKTFVVASDFAKGCSNSAVLTATTGVAALLLGGETLHRFLGIGTTARPEYAGKIINYWNKVKKSSKPWDKAKWGVMQNLKTVFVDEASMLRRDQLELADVVLSNIKDLPVPFGGVQVILVGDFLQLPPVVTSNDLKKYPDLSNPYCFQSYLWNQAQFKSLNLTTNYRQDDEEFIKILEKIRIGKVDKEVEDFLNSRVGAKLETPMRPVKLYSLKHDVFKENIRCLKELPGEKLVSEAEYEGKEYDCEVLKKECPAPDKLYFCKNAQIMMLTNDPNGKWVNGTMGIVESTYPLKVRLSNGMSVVVPMHKWERKIPNVKLNGEIEYKVVASMSQYPIRLSYSTTIHRSQGLSLDFIEADLSNCFSSGQFYVALSRAKTANGITLRGWSKKSVMADPRVLKFYGIK